MAVTILLKLAGLADNPRYLDIGHRALASMESIMAQYRLGFGHQLRLPHLGLAHERRGPAQYIPRQRDLHRRAQHVAS
jgi:hypothetical protein